MKQENDHKIYMYTNQINGKIYIGRTCTSLSKRAGKNGKGYEYCPRFWNAIKKYGWDNFIPQILEDNLSPEEAGKKELEYIKEYNSTDINVGYNIVDVPSSDFNTETRKKMSNNMKGENNPHYGKHLSEEHKESIRESNRRRIFTPEIRANMSKAQKGKHCGKDHSMYGRHHSEEAKRKVSEANKGRIPWNKGKSMKDINPNWVSPNKGKHLSEEAKRKLSEANKGRIPPAARPVRCIETGIEYKSASHAKRATGCDNSRILKCCKKKIKTVNGFHWEYADKRPDTLN